MVLAGELLMARARARGVSILPVDSEHSAIYQSLAGHNRAEVRRLILTASGGPLRNVPAAELPGVSRERALKHPNWSMGDKITIDSATLMNKGLEVIEARWLFGVEPSRIDIVVHPESVVHSMVEYIDGSLVAQLGVSDMRGPISYAMGHPQRLPLDLAPLDLVRLGRLTFEPPDPERFPAFTLAYRALERGGTSPAALSGADEAAVAAFLAGRCRFTDIAEVCADVLEAHAPEPLRSVEQALAASDEGRRLAELRVARTAHGLEAR
jgi:1-deoxy-D-xylulose-5-phosphate reductoisomerase